MDFFRFPHTPHLAWLSTGQPRDDKVLSPQEAVALLAHDVTVEEKIDGANLGFSVGEDCVLRLQNRGSYLNPATAHPQFKPLWRWLEPRREALLDALFPDLMLFGEWCYAVHSIHYTGLPDWFLAFDVYDRAQQHFWSVERRDALFAQLEFRSVPRIASGRFGVPDLERLLGTSRYGKGPAEGLYVRHDAGGRLQSRAKLVRPAFTQAIEGHWSQRALETNGLVRRDG